MDSIGPPDIVVVAGGAPVSFDTSALGGARVVAADSGVTLARSMGLDVDVAVGDFDSLAPDLVVRLDDLAPDVRRYPTDKQATDLELALEVAAERGPARVLVVGLEGGRPDHALANLLVAASPRFAALSIELVLGLGSAWVVRDQLVGHWPADTTLSIIPVHGEAMVSVTGVQWPLDRSLLTAGTTRGVSNSTLADTCTVTVHAGVAICIVPRTTENTP
ncbi:thiamine diphosphokinase [Actinospongicola halichondriae]|uniref:thiamine diphosphokinase n=1 Tax=Actinospongicola halichondriae TaxID=3236844 RepID=UPI003D56EF9F